MTQDEIKHRLAGGVLQVEITSRDFYHRMPEEYRMSAPKPRWSELKAKGIQRCCTTFNFGRQCRRRVERDVEGASLNASEHYCARHKWVDRVFVGMNKMAIDSLRNQSRRGKR